MAETPDYIFVRILNCKKLRLNAYNFIFLLSIANWSPKVGEDKVASGMETAFKLWSRYSHLRFVRVYDPDADIIVAFGSSYHGDNFPFDGPGNVLAHAFYPYEMSSFGGDIHFDNDENWKENSINLYDGVDFQSVAIHELGHSLGLAHSPVHSSIMFPYYKGPDESKDLNYDDIMAMYELYSKFFFFIIFFHFLAENSEINCQMFFYIFTVK